MAEFRELYSLPEIYDIVFQRPTEREVDFISNLFARANGRAPSSALEVACGPGYHARTFAGRGVRTEAFDLESSMIEFADKQAATDASPPNYFVADMRDFTLDAPVDVAFAVLDGIDSLVTTDELLQHLGCVAEALCPGGLYVLDNMHPRDVNMTSYEPVIYEGSRDGVDVRIVYGASPPVLDLTRQTATAETTIEIQSADARTTLRSTAVERFMTVQELSALAHASGQFELYGTWGDFDLTTPFDLSLAATRMIVALRRHPTEQP